MNEAAGKLSLCSNENTFPEQPHGLCSLLFYFRITFLAGCGPRWMELGGEESLTFWKKELKFGI